MGALDTLDAAHRRVARDLSDGDVRSPETLRRLRLARRILLGTAPRLPAVIEERLDELVRGDAAILTREGLREEFSRLVSDVLAVQTGVALDIAVSGTSRVPEVPRGRVRKV